MKILAVDIGAGTRDILLYDSEKQLENCIKLVLPSPSPLFAARVAEETARTGDLYFKGCVIGGGSFSRAVKRHVAEGRHVYMQAATAFCLRNNLEDVMATGVEVVERDAGWVSQEPSSSWTNWTSLRWSPCCCRWGEPGGDGCRGGSGAGPWDLSYRCEQSQDPPGFHAGAADGRPRPNRLAFLEGEVPDQFPRMRSAMGRLRDQLSCRSLLVMDTAPAAVAGCLADAEVEKRLDGNLLVINAGNGHTMCCLLSGGDIVGLLEHHTKYLEPPDVFGAYLELFCDGKARDEDEYMKRGHGLFYLTDPRVSTASIWWR